MMNKRSIYLILGIFIMIGGIFSSTRAIFFNNQLWVFPNLYQNDNQGIISDYFPVNSRNVFIELNTTGSSYGHELLWKANTTGTNYEESAVVYTDGVAYIGSCSTHGDGHDMLFAVNTTNGEILWSKFIGPGYVGPVIDNDTIYIGTSSHGYYPEDEYVYAINRFDGTELWRRKIYGGIPESIQYDEHNIYFCSNVIYALRKHDGSINWTFQMDTYSVTKPLLKDNAFYAASARGRLYKINAIDGSKYWEISLSGFPWDNSITSDGNDRLFLAIYSDRTINCYQEHDGSLIWTYHLRGESLSFNAYHNQVVFIADTSGYVYALHATDGTLLWENKIGNTFDISSPTLSGGLLFIGTRDGNLGAFYAIDEVTGTILWRYPLGASITAPPSVADGMMLCGADDWYMYAFDFGTGTGDWPLHRYDEYNTAYSPDGLTKWQYVMANCTTHMNVTTCTITNTYDHDVINIILHLKNDMIVDWYDVSGNLLKSKSNNFTIDFLSSSSSSIYLLKYETQVPNKPSKPLGPITGKSGILYTYTTQTTDPNEDAIYYWFDWGDGSASGWLGPYRSGEKCNASHIWTTQGSYQIKSKAKDVYSWESPWSDPLPVTMPYSKIFHTNFIMLKALSERLPLLLKILEKIE